MHLIYDILQVLNYSKFLEKRNHEKISFGFYLNAQVTFIDSFYFCSDCFRLSYNLRSARLSCLIFSLSSMYINTAGAELRQFGTSRHLLQRDNVHGGQLCGDDHHGPQLPPQAGGDPRDAGLGEDHLPPVGALAAQDEQARGEDHQEDDTGDNSDLQLAVDSGIVQVQKKMKELDKKEIKSRSLMANIVDTDDDFHPMTKSHLVHPSKPLSNICMTRSDLTQLNPSQSFLIQ